MSLPMMASSALLRAMRQRCVAKQSSQFLQADTEGIYHLEGRFEGVGVQCLLLLHGKSQEKAWLAAREAPRPIPQYITYSLPRISPAFRPLSSSLSLSTLGAHEAP
jgi:hypothetical protein